VSFEQLDKVFIQRSRPFCIAPHTPHRLATKRESRHPVKNAPGTRYGFDADQSHR
jgi:hypothetical protein